MADYPQTRRDDVVEVLHGRPIADPYRWLEDPDSAETADWVKRQNEVTEAYLEALPGAGLVHRHDARDPGPAAGGRAVPQGRPLLRLPATTAPRTRTCCTSPTPWTSSRRRPGAGRPEHVLRGRHQRAEHLHCRPAQRVRGVRASATVAATGPPSICSTWPPARRSPIPRSITKFSAAEWLPDGRSYLYTHFDHAGRRRGHRGDGAGRAAPAAAPARRRPGRRPDDPGVPGERPAVLLG